MKFGINFTSCSENGNEITRGAAECNFVVITTTSGIYPKISLLLALSQINTIASFVKVKISDIQTRFTMSSGFFALLTPARHDVKAENRSGLTFFVHRADTDSLSS